MHKTRSAHEADTLARRLLAPWSLQRSPSLVLMLGEAERRSRFGYALQMALEARSMSERQLAKSVGVDPRRVAGWRRGQKLPDLYEIQAIVDVLKVSEELFRNPPPVPKPPPYPIERYLLEAAEEGVSRGLSGSDPDDEDGAEPGEPTPLHPR